MRSSDVIRNRVEASGTWSIRALSQRLGMMPQTFNNRLKAKSVGVGFLVACLDVLGYRLVAVPITSKLPSGSIEVTDEMAVRPAPEIGRAHV